MLAWSSEISNKSSATRVRFKPERTGTPFQFFFLTTGPVLFKCPEERIVNTLNEHRSSRFSAYSDLPKVKHDLESLLNFNYIVTLQSNG